MTLMMIMIYPEARMTVPFSAITKIGGEFVLKQRTFISVTVIIIVMSIPINQFLTIVVIMTIDFRSTQTKVYYKMIILLKILNYTKSFSSEEERVLSSLSLSTPPHHWQHEY